jgi:hypothetical protein
MLLEDFILQVSQVNKSKTEVSRFAHGRHPQQ